MEWLPPQHQGYGGKAEGRYHFRDGKTCVHVPSRCIEQNQKSVHTVIILYFGQLRQYMVVFRGFAAAGGILMSLHLPNNGNEMDFPLPAVVLQDNLAVFFQLIVFLFLYFLFKLLGLVVLLAYLAVSVLHLIVSLFSVIFSLSHNQTTLS